MPKVTDEEKEDIADLIREGLTLGEIEKATGRSKNTIYRVASEYELTLQKKEREGSQEGRGGPYGEADRETYRHVKAFVKGVSKRSVDDILETGQLLYEKYSDTAKKYNVSLYELAEKALEFFLEESIMIEAYKRQIQLKNKEIRILKATLDTTTLMRQHLMELSMGIMAQNKKVDYESALNSAKALATAVNQLQIGEFEYGRREIVGNGSQPGNIEGPTDTQIAEQGDNDLECTNDTFDDANGLEPTATDSEPVPDDDGHHESKDDAEPSGGPSEGITD